MAGVAQRIRRRRAARMEGTLPRVQQGSPAQEGAAPAAALQPGEAGTAPPQVLYDPQLRLSPCANFGSTVGAHPSSVWHLQTCRVSTGPMLRVNNALLMFLHANLLPKKLQHCIVYGKPMFAP